MWLDYIFILYLFWLVWMLECIFLRYEEGFKILNFKMKMFLLEVLINVCIRINFLIYICISGNCLLDGKFKIFIYISISIGIV